MPALLMLSAIEVISIESRTRLLGELHFLMGGNQVHDLGANSTLGGKALE